MQHSLSSAGRRNDAGMTLKQACAYLRKDKVILGPVSVTTAGVGVAVEPFLCIEVENIGELGKGVLATLEKSQHGVPHPKQDQWKALLAPMLKAAGVKSWSSFTKSARNSAYKCVAIRFEANQVLFQPFRNLGPRGGFEELPSGRARTSAPTDLEVGSTLLAAFADAE
jgi:hypothetical protein